MKRGGIFFSEVMTCEGGFDPAVVGADPASRISLACNRYWMTRDEGLAELQQSGLEVLYEQLKPQPEAPGVGSLLTVYARRNR